MVKPHNEKISGLPFIDLHLHPDMPNNLIAFNEIPGAWETKTIKGKKFIQWNMKAR